MSLEVRERFEFVLFGILGTSNPRVPLLTLLWETVQKALQGQEEKEKSSSSVFPIRSMLFAFSPAPSEPGIGFGNKSANCWCNATLQMVFRSPFFRQMYLTTVLYYEAQGKPAGNALLEAIRRYDTEAAKPREEQRSLEESVSQSVRLAFCDLGASFSKNAWVHEDVAEALIFLEGKHQDIVPHIPNMKMKKTLRPTTTPAYSIEAKGHGKSSLKLDAQGIGRVRAYSCEFLLNVPLSTGITDLQSLFAKTLFHEKNQGEDEPALYKISYGKDDPKVVKECDCISEEISFLTPPEEFIVALKRFGADRSKNSNPVTPALNLEIAEKKSSIPYALQGVIVHLGTSIHGGHYVYWHLEEKGWTLYNDSRVSQIEGGKEAILTHPEVLKGGYLFRYGKKR